MDYCEKKQATEKKIDTEKKCRLKCQHTQWNLRSLYYIIWRNVRDGIVFFQFEFRLMVPCCCCCTSWNSCENRLHAQQHKSDQKMHNNSHTNTHTHEHSHAHKHWMPVLIYHILQMTAINFRNIPWSNQPKLFPKEMGWLKIAQQLMHSVKCA